MIPEQAKISIVLEGIALVVVLNLTLIFDATCIIFHFSILNSDQFSDLAT
jgi:hypothetical protein